MAAEQPEEGGLREVKRKRTKPRPKVCFADAMRRTLSETAEILTASVDH